jgi:hypothetical protein
MSRHSFTLQISVFRLTLIGRTHQPKSFAPRLTFPTAHLQHFRAKLSELFHFSAHTTGGVLPSAGESMNLESAPTTAYNA